MFDFWWGPEFAAEEWQLLLIFRVIAPVGQYLTCAGCHTAIDDAGEHAVCCAATGLAKRHNRVRRTLLHLGREAGWNPELEVSLPAPDPPGGSVRPIPADVVFRTAESKPLAIDVTVVHPLRPSRNIAAGDNTTAAAQAELAKSANQTCLCASAGWSFIPFGMETTGGLGPKASSVFKHMCRNISMRSGEPIADVLGRTSASLTVALAKGRAETLCRAFKPF